MTIERITPEQQEMRDFVDALRCWLGKAPLYLQDLKTEEERFGGSEVTLASAKRPDEWFRAVAAAPDERVQDRSVEIQMKKLSSAEHREKLRQNRTAPWRGDARRDSSVRDYTSIEGQLQFSRKAY